MNCKVLNCQNHVRSNGLCSAHYFRLRKYGCYDLPKPRSINLLCQSKGFCSKCRLIKSLNEFNVDKHTITGYARYCRSCNKQKSNLRYSLNPEKHKNTQLKSDFGITLIQYNQILQNQNGVCAICGKTPKENKKRLAVDHCHQTGKIRGLLCKDCNIGLGHFLDTICLLEKAVVYLKKNESEDAPKCQQTVSTPHCGLNRENADHSSLNGRRRFTRSGKRN